MGARNPYQPPLAPPQDGALIQMRGITKVFKTAAGEIPVLKGINADFYAGEFVSVVGRSGSGKSTLVNMLTGIDHPTAGTVEVAGTQVHRMSESRMCVWRGRNLGIVFQFFQLLPMLSLVENVMLPMDFCNIYPPAERPGRALALLERVGLLELAHKLPGAISGGQQQSAAVARALANDPPIIVADEPTGNLDSRTAESVIALFEELVGQGKTIIMVTHDASLARRTGRSLLISDGELVPPGVVQAFPALTPSRLLQVAALARPLALPAGATLALQDREYYALTSGSLLVRAAGERGAGATPQGGAGATLARIQACAAFDQPTLQRYLGRPGPYSMVAAVPAELLVFERAALLPLLAPVAPGHHLYTPVETGRGPVSTGHGPAGANRRPA